MRPTDCGVSERDHESSIMRRPWPTGVNCALDGDACCCNYGLSECGQFPGTTECKEVGLMGAKGI
jgi:hypothetical protein